MLDSKAIPANYLAGSGAKIIDGRRHARELRDVLRVEAKEFAAKYGAQPKLTVVLVGDDPASGPAVQVTISVGVASLNGESRELTDMLAAADAALYYAKETGRNQVKMATDPSHADHE